MTNPNQSYLNFHFPELRKSGISASKQIFDSAFHPKKTCTVPGGIRLQTKPIMYKTRISKTLKNLQSPILRERGGEITTHGFQL